MLPILLDWFVSHDCTKHICTANTKNWTIVSSLFLLLPLPLLFYSSFSPITTIFLLFLLLLLLPLLLTLPPPFLIHFPPRLSSHSPSSHFSILHSSILHSSPYPTLFLLRLSPLSLLSDLSSNGGLSYRIKDRGMDEQMTSLLFFSCTPAEAPTTVYWHHGDTTNHNPSWI